MVQIRRKRRDEPHVFFRVLQPDLVVLLREKRVYIMSNRDEMLSQYRHRLLQLTRHILHTQQIPDSLGWLWWLSSRCKTRLTH